ncbi:MAG: hypothetical protein U1A27_10030 [Phycisphaerae bacterium]
MPIKTDEARPFVRAGALVVLTAPVYVIYGLFVTSEMRPDRAGPGTLAAWWIIVTAVSTGLLFAGRRLRRGRLVGVSLVLMMLLSAGSILSSGLGIAQGIREDWPSHFVRFFCYLLLFALHCLTTLGFVGAAALHQQALRRARRSET